MYLGKWMILLIYAYWHVCDRLTDLIQRPNAVYIVTDYLDMVIDS